jgi:hypothetical protein
MYKYKIGVQEMYDFGECVFIVNHQSKILNPCICSENIIRHLTKINATNFFTVQRKRQFLTIVHTFGFH